MTDVIRRGEWLLQREPSVITTSLSTLLDYLLLRCSHETCEVHYFCLSVFSHIPSGSICHSSLQVSSFHSQ